MNTHATATIEGHILPTHDAITFAAKPKMFVSFSQSVTIQPVEKLSTTPEEKARLYYSKDEMRIFSQEAKATQTLLKRRITPEELSASDDQTPKRDCMLVLEEDVALRGLEFYLCPIRVQNKILANKAMISYMKILHSDCTKTREEKILRLAGASAKLSRWSRLIAMETARLDSLRAYGAIQKTISLNSMPVAILPFPISTTKRRRVTCDEDSKLLKKGRS